VLLKDVAGVFSDASNLRRVSAPVTNCKCVGRSVISRARDDALRLNVSIHSLPPDEGLRWSTAWLFSPYGVVAGWSDGG
jgi:hypothetical protein